MNLKGRHEKSSPKHKTANATWDGAQRSRDASTCFNQANDLYRSNRFDEALAAYNKAIALRPNFAEAFVNRGNLLKSMGRFVEAMSSYDTAVALMYTNEALYYNRGLTLAAMGRFENALRSYEKAIALRPGFAEAHNNMGAAMEALNRPNEALASYEKAISIKPDYAEAYNNRGNVLLKIDPGNNIQAMQSLRHALENYERAIALKPNFAEAHSNRGNVLHEMGRLQEALESYDKSISFFPNLSKTYLLRGITQISLGNMKDAECMLRKALAQMPNSPKALYYLSYIGKYESADVEIIEAALQTPSLSLDDKVHLNFALGKVYDDSRDYDKAFEYYRQANDLVNTTVSHDRDVMTEVVENTIRVFDRDYMRQSFGFTSASKQPLFIVGMPRSGTTLLATMLSNHDSVETAGELATFLDFTKILPELIGTDVVYPDVVKQITPEISERLIGAFIQRLTRDATPGATFVIDKQPMNFIHLGLISMLFPESRVIHCTRDPMDTGLSNYFQMFTRDAGWSFDLRNIGHLHKEYEKLMRHWRNSLPLKMIQVSYESVTGDTERVVRDILEFLDLDWNERCVDPQSNTGGVQTPSSWQVRQPIYRKSVERWRHYEKHLIPLQEALGDQ